MQVYLDFAKRLEKTPHGKRVELVEGFADAHNTTTQKVYDKLNDLRQKGLIALKQKKIKSNAGKSKWLDDEIKAIWECQLKLSPGERNGRLIPASDAIKDALEKGLISRPIPAASYNRRVRSLGLNDTRKLHTRFTALKANVMHQSDCTGSKNMRIGKDGKIIISRIIDKKVRQQNPNLNLWVCGVIDDYSRFAFYQYFEADGENSADVLNILEKAWREYFLSCPERLYSDNGSAFRNVMTATVMADLGIEQPGSEPYNSRARGKIENLMKEVNKQDLILANKLHLSGQKITLKELNQHVISEILPVINGRKHPDLRLRHKTREQVYRESFATQETRPCPVQIGRCLIPVREDAKVNGAGVVRVDNIEYELPKDLKPKLQDRTVNVYESLKGGYKILYRDKKRVCMTQLDKLFEHNDVGVFKGIADTPRERAAKQAAKNPGAIEVKPPVEHQKDYFDRSIDKETENNQPKTKKPKARSYWERDL